METVATDKFCEEIANQLLEAEVSMKPIAPLTETYPTISVQQAYQIQLLQIQQKVDQGARIIGKKIGLTSKAMQEMVGVNEPDYGHLLDTMSHVDGEIIDIDQFIEPKIEVEIAFILSKDLKGPGVSITNVIDATDYIVPAFEVIDSRIKDWKIKFEDTVADNGSSAKVVLGGIPTKIDQVDLRHIGMVVDVNGAQIATGAGAAVLGNPLKAVAWLANKLGEYDISLKAGEVILSGAITAAVPIRSGDIFNAHFAHIGSVSVGFKGGDSQ
ncbi:MAG: 2-oxopent-4-enoate hydratase [Bacillus sp. (in: firmicutes)]|jgi:2-keto-4-pentenoate hydratase|nr:2-oxopent-4-enoate hydratase [Bacillus sp. (in: firmicutes)]